MTQEERQLLLVDLLPRILHGIKIHHYQGSDCVLKSIDLRTYAAYVEVYDFIALKEFIEDGQRSIFEYKPYLRPISSMTEEEKKEFAELFYKWHDDELFDYIEEGVEFSIWKHKGISPVIFDWLNAHHFDYRGLIPMGLALEAPEEMYNIKTE